MSADSCMKLDVCVICTKYVSSDLEQMRADKEAAKEARKGKGGCGGGKSTAPDGSDISSGSDFDITPKKVQLSNKTKLLRTKLSDDDYDSEALVKLKKKG